MVKGFKLFQKDYKMAPVQMGSEEEVVLTLTELHNHDLSKGHYLQFVMPEVYHVGACGACGACGFHHSRKAHSKKQLK